MQIVDKCLMDSPLESSQSQKVWYANSNKVNLSPCLCHQLLNFDFNPLIHNIKSELQKASFQLSVDK